MKSNDKRATEPAHAEDELVPEDDQIIGRALRRSLIVICGLVAIFALVTFLRREEPEPEQVLEKTVGEIASLKPEAAVVPDVRFTDVTRQAGIDFERNDGATGDKLLPETMGGGAAFLDFDGDGDQDLLFVDGAPIAAAAEAGSSSHRLYENDGTGAFTDVTAAWGLAEATVGMGVAVADYDADGRVDVFITGLGTNQLWRNTGSSFEQVAAQAGVAGSPDQWTTSAGFFDYDKDGDLDLFVCHYVRWTRELDLQLAFTLNGTDRAYGPPMDYAGTFPALYRNDGDGSFTDVSEAAGLNITNEATGLPMGKALGVVFIDVDGDGWEDVLVANDTVANHLFRNRGDNTFEEIGTPSGVAYDSNGKATGAMGIDVADYRNDGGVGVCIGNFANEMSSLYVRPPQGAAFSDHAMVEGIGSPSRRHLSFGVFFFDYDLDGRLDLLQVNGHLEDTIQEVQPSQHYEQPPQLFWNAGPTQRRCFAEVPVSDAGDLDRKLAGRGSAYADIDADGDLDVLLVQVAGPPVLLRNDQQLGHHWLRVRLADNAPNTQAIGARVTLTTPTHSLTRQLTATRSYLSQSELPITFGLGSESQIESLQITWPDGESQTIATPEIDRELVIRR